MARRQYTVDSLVAQVRSQLDEQNTDAVDTTNDIMPTLNRGLTKAIPIYARHFPDPFLQHAVLQLTSEAEYEIPADVFSDYITKVEISINNTQRPVTRISASDISNYESSSTTNTPYYWCQVGDKIRFVPTPTGTYSARIWYMYAEFLVQPQGRITNINTASNYVVVDSQGSELTTESDQLGSYVNLINGRTGRIRGTLQISNLVDGRVVFRATPTRSEVLGRTVLGDLADVEDLELDDYLAPIQGTCIPFFSDSISNFLVEFAANRIRARLDKDMPSETDMLEKLEGDLKREFAGRENTLRIKKRSAPWGVPTRRWYWE